MNKPTCDCCKWWGTDQVWVDRLVEWASARQCLNESLGAASFHPAGPNYEGSITTLPGFGCNQFEPRTEGLNP